MSGTPDRRPRDPRSPPGPRDERDPGPGDPGTLRTPDPESPRTLGAPAPEPPAHPGPLGVPPGSDLLPGHLLSPNPLPPGPVFPALPFPIPRRSRPFPGSDFGDFSPCSHSRALLPAGIGISTPNPLSSLKSHKNKFTRDRAGIHPGQDRIQFQPGFTRDRTGSNSSPDSPGTGPDPIPARIHPGQDRNSPGTGQEFTRDRTGSNSSPDLAPEPGEENSEEAAPECGRLEDLLEDLKNELEKRQEKKETEISQPDTAAEEQEEKNPQPDVKNSISRCGKVTFQLPPGLEERVCHFSWRSSALKETLRKLQASVTLDPDTAHPELVLSEDGKSVWRGAGARQLPDIPQRFDHWPFVLGHQAFVAGRHCWDVAVGDSGDWAVGVALESVRRKGRLSLGPQGGIWGLEKWGGQLRALTARRVTLVALRWLPRRVSVHLDCAAGTVAFFDAEDGGLLFVFSRASFGGEGVRPWLWVVGARSQLRLCP